MSKHTPEPWEVRSRFDIYAAGYYVGTTRGNDDLPPHISATDAANATLIAAAPDLLRELKRMTDLAERLGANIPELLRARIAIAKAEGRDRA